VEAGAEATATAVCAANSKGSGMLVVGEVTGRLTRGAPESTGEAEDTAALRAQAACTQRHDFWVNKVSKLAFFLRLAQRENTRSSQHHWSSKCFMIAFSNPSRVYLKK